MKQLQLLKHYKKILPRLQEDSWQSVTNNAQAIDIVNIGRGEEKKEQCHCSGRVGASRTEEINSPSLTS